MSSTVKLNWFTNEGCSLCQQIWLAHSSRQNLTVFLGSYLMEDYVSENDNKIKRKMKSNAIDLFMCSKNL